MESESFFANGFTLVPELLPKADCELIATRFTLAESKSAGSRCLLSRFWCAALAKRLRQMPTLNRLIPQDFSAVQCTYFEKSIHRNWIVPVHQDLSIPVAEKMPHANLGGWSEKEGNIFVQAPPEVLEQLVAVRLHLDVCSEEDGPVRVFSGSHHLGRIDPERAAAEKTNFEEVVCTAQPGTALVMRPLLLHASSKASGNSLRRVLHFLFGPPSLPYGLKWRYGV